jgi:RNA polymerase sigma-70 factor, ECF subfamily
MQNDYVIIYESTLINRGRTMIDSENFISYLKKRNVTALDYVIDTYSKKIFSVAYGILNNSELSEECLNDVLLKIWDNIKYFNREKEKFYPWIIAITKNTAIDILRKEIKHFNKLNIENIVISKEYSFDKKIDNKEKLKDVTKEIKSMNDIDKEIFLRKFYLDQSSKIISEKMGLKDKFINLRIFRARKKLQNKFNTGE